jgi:hypothetical protein
MCALANMKMMSSWGADGRATIPCPGEMTVDVDTKEGPRRFFAVDTQAGAVRYAGEFEQRPVNLSPEAIEFMSEPLPDHRLLIVEQTKDRSRPRVVSVQPAPGAAAVPTETELRVRFDRPMDPLALGLTWESGDGVAGDFPRYDTNTFEFSVPLRLAAGVLHQIVVNTDEPGGGLGSFLSADGKPAALYAWRFITENGPPGLLSAKAAGPVAPAGSGVASPAVPTEPNLSSLLQSMQQQRAGMTSVVERVQTIYQFHSRGFRKLTAQGATFR